MAPYLSLCIPTYNRADYLERLLKSIAGNTLQPDFLLISDNHSIDHTLEVTKKFSFLKPKVISQPRNIGMDENIVFCFRESQGDFVWVLGDDDVLETNAIEAVRAELLHTESDLLYLNHRPLLSDGTVLQPRLPRKKPRYIYPPGFELLKMSRTAFPIITCQVIRRQPMVTLLNSLDLDYLNGTGMKFLPCAFRILEQHPSTYLADPLVQYQCGNSWSGVGIVEACIDATVRILQRETYLLKRRHRAATRSWCDELCQTHIRPFVYKNTGRLSRERWNLYLRLILGFPASLYLYFRLPLAFLFKSETPSK